MQPLLMLKQTLEGPYDPGPLWIDGPNVKFTSADQFFSINSEESLRFHIQKWQEKEAQQLKTVVKKR